MKLLSILLFLTSFVYAQSEFHMSNDFNIYYNEITGNGKDSSALTEGWSYIDVLNLNGFKKTQSYSYNYNFGFKFTDDKKNDIKNISLTNLSGSFRKGYNLITAGDIFESFSQYTLASSLKGVSYKFSKESSKLPEITAVFGHTYPRWDSYFKDPDTRVSKRQAYGFRLKENLADFSLGVNYLNTKDIELVRETQKYDSSNYSLDLKYNPFAGLELNGEYAKSDTDEKLSDKSIMGEAYRFEFVGDADPSRLSIEYENVDPDYLSLLGSAVSDRRKVKAKWRYKYSKMTTINTGILWYRDNLENQKIDTTYTLRPDISMSVKKIFASRPYSYANFSYKFDRRYGANSQKDHFFNINYRDKYSEIENDINLGYTIYKTDKNVRDANEINFNTSFNKYIENENTILRPQLTLGSWYSNDELSNETNRIYEYSLGLGFDKPKKKISGDIRMGQNFLKQEEGDDSDKLFASFNFYYKTKVIKMDTTFSLRGVYNNYNFSTDTKDFREKSVSFQISTLF